MYPILLSFSMVWLMGMTLSAFALSTDSTQVLHITSKSAVYNYKTGVDIYEGEVKVQQGSTHLLADKLITKKNAQHVMIEATAYGTHLPAHFWTLPNEIDPEIHAFARVIIFYPPKSDATLQQQVMVKQGNNRFEGELVLYNNEAQTITVPETQQGRVTITYHPEQK